MEKLILQMMAATLLLAVFTVHAENDSARISVGVMDFTNTAESSEYRGLGVALREWLVTDLSNVGALRLVERGRIAELMQELKLQETAFIDPATLAKLGKGIGADAVLVGSFFVGSEKMRIDARLIDVETGLIIQAEKIEGKRDQFFKLEKDLSAKIIESFGIKLSAFEKTRLKQVYTKNMDAAAAFGQAQRFEETGDIGKASKLVGQALEKDAEFKLAKDLSDRIAGLLDEIKSADFKKKLCVVAEFLWSLENAPTYIIPPTDNYDSILWRRLPFSQVEYEKIVKESGRQAGMVYRLERTMKGYYCGLSCICSTDPPFMNEWSGIENFRENMAIFTASFSISDIFREVGLLDEYIEVIDMLLLSDFANKSLVEAQRKSTAFYFDEIDVSQTDSQIRSAHHTSQFEIEIAERNYSLLLNAKFYANITAGSLDDAVKIMEQVQKSDPSSLYLPTWGQCVESALKYPYLRRQKIAEMKRKEIVARSEIPLIIKQFSGYWRAKNMWRYRNLKTSIYESDFLKYAAEEYRSAEQLATKGESSSGSPEVGKQYYEAALEKFKESVKKKVTLEQREKDLIECIRENDVKKFQQFISSGVDLNACFNIYPFFEETPLMLASRGSADVVKFLIDAEVDLNSKNGRGETALKIAVSHGNTNIVRLLRDAGARR